MHPSYLLTHWGRVTLICVSKLTIMGSDNGSAPGRRPAIIRTNARILLIGPLGKNFSENLIGILTFSFTKMHFKMSSAKWRPFCLGLNVLKPIYRMQIKINCSQLWGCFILGPNYIKVYQYKNTNHQNERISRWSYLYNGNPLLGIPISLLKQSHV